jgi:hypothetical protein
VRLRQHIEQVRQHGYPPLRLLVHLMRQQGQILFGKLSACYCLYCHAAATPCRSGALLMRACRVKLSSKHMGGLVHGSSLAHLSCERC